MPLCRNGHEVALDASFCNVCGSRIDAAAAPPTDVISTQPLATEAIATRPLGADESMLHDHATEVFATTPPPRRFEWPRDHPIWSAAIGIVAFVLLLVLIASLIHPKPRQSTALASPIAPVPTVTPPTTTPAPTIETP